MTDATNLSAAGAAALADEISTALDAMAPLLARQDPDDLGALAQSAEAARDTVAHFAYAWRRLPRSLGRERSLMLTAALDSLAAHEERVNESSGPFAAAGSVDSEHAELVLLDARVKVAREIARTRTTAGITQRSLASTVDISVSYLSELEGAVSGLPTPEVARKLDMTLKSNVREIAATARTRAEELRERGRSRLDLSRRYQLDSGPRSSLDVRLARVTGALAGDPGLLESVEEIAALSPQLRAAVARLARDLASASLAARL